MDFLDCPPLARVWLQHSNDDLSNFRREEILVVFVFRVEVPEDIRFVGHEQLIVGVSWRSLGKWGRPCEHDEEHNSACEDVDQFAVVAGLIDDFRGHVACSAALSADFVVAILVGERSKSEISDL